MSVNKKVPEIRFKEFSGEWGTFPLDEISDVLDGDRGHHYPNGEDLKEQGHTLFLSASNVTKNGFKFDIKQYITQDKSERLGNGKLILDDIILTSRGSIGHIAWYNENIYKKVPFARINSGMLILRAKNFSAPSVISHYLKSPKGKKKIDVISFGSAQPQLTKASVSKYLVSIPSDESEQEKVGNYFQKLDALINQHQQKHDKLSNIKKAMLAKMFPKHGKSIPEIRFKGFCGCWAENILSEVANVIDPHPSHRAPDAVDNGVPFIGIGDISDVGLVDWKDVRVVSSRIYSEHSARYTIEKGDFAYGRVASVGKIIDLSNNVGCEYTYSPTMAIVKPTSLYPAYLRNYLQTEVFKDHVANKTSGSTRKSLGVQDFRCLPVLFPLKEEQTAIGNYFQKLDSLISQHQQQITKLNDIKQACLSKMFV